MAADYLSSLISSLGGEQEGPDPNRLEGLAQLLRSEDPEAADHLPRMQGRIQEALRDRQGNYEARRESLSPEVSALIERNLGSCQVLEQTLGQLIEGVTEELREIFERAASEFLETSDQLAALAASGTPLCPRCGSQGEENLCPACQLDRLIPDPDVGQMEYNRAVVGEEFLAVYHAYAEVVEGQSSLEPLMMALQSLEFSLLEAQALAEQAAEDSPPHQKLLDVINEAVEGVNRLHAVQENRLTRELHQGWTQVFNAAAVVPQLLAVPEEEFEQPEEVDEDEESQ